MPDRRSRLLSLALGLGLAGLLSVGCSVSTPKLQPGPPVTTGPVPTTTTSTIPGQTTVTTAASSSSGSSVPTIGPAGCAAVKSIPVATTTRVATARSSLTSLRVYASATAPEPCATLPNPDADYHQPQVFMVLQQAGDWVQVALPVRPNESAGWVHAADVSVTQHNYRIQISLSGHRVTVFKGSQQIIDTPAGVGKGETPTPPGVYYLVALIKPTNSGYGPYAYALSGHSQTPGLENFGGGEGRLGLHGTDSPGSIGKDASHGCIRIPNDVITRMAEQVGLPLGVPVTVTA